MPSVTTLMRPLNEKYYGGINKDVLSSAAELGTKVHRAIEFFEKVGDEGDYGDANPYMEQYRNWRKSRDILVMEQEIKVFSKTQRYAGTVDMVVLGDDGVGLIDIKTPVQKNLKLWAVQLAGYVMALELAGDKIDYAGILHVTKDNCTLYKISSDELLRAELVFRALVLIHSYI